MTKDMSWSSIKVRRYSKTAREDTCVSMTRVSGNVITLKQAIRLKKTPKLENGKNSTNMGLESSKINTAIWSDLTKMASKSLFSQAKSLFAMTRKATGSRRTKKVIFTDTTRRAMSW